MRACLRAALAGFALASLCAGETPAPAEQPEPCPPSILAWRKLAPIPDAEGFAGIFAGVSGGSLLVAGGANFPGKKPWEGGAKQWSAKVFALDRPNGAWKIAGQLPRPLGYGLSATAKDGVICAGGSDSQRHYQDVFLLHWTGADLEIRTLPSLPRPCANLSGAVLGDTIYAAGGLAEPGSTEALKTFWSLDLRHLSDGWRELEPWPGPGRMLAVAAADGASFSLFSGAALRPGQDGKPVREWLRDAYLYTPGSGWRKLPDLPHPTIAAPSPAPSLNGRLLVFGGDDGSQIGAPPAAHRGFPRRLLAFDPPANRWHEAEPLPFGLVTTVAIAWNDLLVIPGGEIRPGVRSTEVWAARRN